MLVVGFLAGVGQGCATYRPGSFAAPGQGFSGQHRTVGCFDVAVELMPADVTSDPVIGYTAGNRCDEAVRLDLGAVRVVGRTGGGREVELAPFDPEGQLRSALLEARSVAREQISYRAAPVAADPEPGSPLVSVCVELGGLADRGAAPDRVEACLALPRPIDPAKPGAAPAPAGATTLAWSDR